MWISTTSTNGDIYNRDIYKWRYPLSTNGDIHTKTYLQMCIWRYLQMEMSTQEYIYKSGYGDIYKWRYPHKNISTNVDTLNVNIYKWRYPHRNLSTNVDMEISINGDIQNIYK